VSVIFDSLRGFVQSQLHKAERKNRIVQSQWELRYPRMGLFSGPHQWEMRK
jgi:hypothetical protein